MDGWMDGIKVVLFHQHVAYPDLFYMSNSSRLKTQIIHKIMEITSWLHQRWLFLWRKVGFDVLVLTNCTDPTLYPSFANLFSMQHEIYIYKYSNTPVPFLELDSHK